MREKQQQILADVDVAPKIAPETAKGVLWDFGNCELLKTQTRSDISDPWQPFISKAPEFKAQEPSENTDLFPSNSNDNISNKNALDSNVLFDFWHPHTTSNTQTNNEKKLTSGFADQFNFEFPLPDSDLHTSPFAFEFRKPSRKDIAARRTRNLLAMINDLHSERQRTSLASFFQEVFEIFPHSSTFQRLSDFALDDVPVETIVQTCRFRMNWKERYDWRSFRFKGKFQTSNQCISWRRAWRWVEYCGGSDPADHIEEEWLHLWAGMHHTDPAYNSFADYIEQKLKVFSLGIWPPPEPIICKRSTAIHNLGFDNSYIKSRTGYLVKGICDSPYEYKPKPEFPYEEHAD